MYDKHKFKARALTVIILAAVIAAVHLAIIVLLEHTVGSMTASLISLSSIGILLFATPLRRAVQTWADRAASAGRPVRRHGLAESIGNFDTAGDFDELLDVVMAALESALGAESACLFLSDNGGGYRLHRSYGLPAPDAAGLRMCNELVSLLQETRMPVERLGLRAGGPQKEPKALFQCLTDIGAEVAVPLWRRGELLGILGLGRRKAEGPYHGRELDVIEEFAAAAAGAIESMQQHSSALTDRLTSLPSRSYFLMRIGEEIKEAKRYKYAVSLLVASIDDFTNLNREQGRVAADLVLKEIAAELRSGCRDSDTMARYGREKFAVLLPEASAEDALRVGERLRKKIETLKPEGLQVTVSIGIGHLSARECECFGRDELLVRADRAVAGAKELGKNRVAVGGRRQDMVL
ncbi:MAG: GGDEF domain-containing protein [Nitrospirota bacterium]